MKKHVRNLGVLVIILIGCVTMEQGWRAARAEDAVPGQEAQKKEEEYKAIKDALAAGKTAKLTCGEEFRQAASEVLRSLGWNLSETSADLEISISYISWRSHLKMLEEQVAQTPPYFSKEETEKMVNSGSSSWGIGVLIKDANTGEELFSGSGAYTATTGEMRSKGRDRQYQEKAFRQALENAFQDVLATRGGK